MAAYAPSRIPRSQTSGHKLKRVYLASSLWTKAVLPYFRERKSGHIIQISSIGGRVGPTGRAPYAAAKFGVEGFSESLSKEVGPLGIKVTIVEPGGFRTDFAGPQLSLAKAGRTTTPPLAPQSAFSAITMASNQGIRQKRQRSFCISCHYPILRWGSCWEVTLTTQLRNTLCKFSRPIKIGTIAAFRLTTAFQTSG